MAGHRDAVALDDRLDDRRVAARAVAVQPVDPVHRDELLGDRAREVAAALIVADDEPGRRPAEAREPLARAERHREIRVVVVDDVLDRLPGPEVLLAEAREVAGERQDVADEHLRNARRGRGPVGERRDQENTRDRTRDDGQSSHLTLL